MVEGVQDRRTLMPRRLQGAASGIQYFLIRRSASAEIAILSGLADPCGIKSVSIAGTRCKESNAPEEFAERLITKAAS
jgi:hypothetical protein